MRGDTILLLETAFRLIMSNIMWFVIMARSDDAAPVDSSVGCTDCTLQNLRSYVPALCKRGVFVFFTPNSPGLHETSRCLRELRPVN